MKMRMVFQVRDNNGGSYSIESDVTEVTREEIDAVTTFMEEHWDSLTVFRATQTNPNATLSAGRVAERILFLPKEEVVQVWLDVLE